MSFLSTSPAPPGQRRIVEGRTGAGDGKRDAMKDVRVMGGALVWGGGHQRVEGKTYLFTIFQTCPVILAFMHLYVRVFVCVLF